MHDFHLVSLLFKAMVNLYSLFKFIIFKLFFCTLSVHNIYFTILLATPYEVIDHFTDFLLVSLHDESLLPLMHSYGLLADYDLELITIGPTSYHRNKLILNYVQQMDITGLFIFSEVLQQSHPDITLPLVDGKV